MPPVDAVDGDRGDDGKPVDGDAVGGDGGDGDAGDDDANADASADDPSSVPVSGKVTTHNNSTPTCQKNTIMSPT